MNCGCSNSGCGCRNGTIATLPNGNTFHVRLKLKDNGGESKLQEGCDIIAGFYDRKKQLLLRASTDNDRIKFDEEANLYVIVVGHDESLLMKGTVYVELTLTENEKSNVYHGDKVVRIEFEPRVNNEIIIEKQDLP